MGRSIQAEEQALGRALWESDPLLALSPSELADYACGLLGPLHQMAKQNDLHLLAHLVNMAYAEACWKRQTLK